MNAPAAVPSTTAAAYELSATLGAARAVSGALMDSLPNCQNARDLFPAINHLGNLITGLQILLDSAKNHADALL